MSECSNVVALHWRSRARTVAIATVKRRSMKDWGGPIHADAWDLLTLIVAEGRPLSLDDARTALAAPLSVVMRAIDDLSERRLIHVSETTSTIARLRLTATGRRMATDVFGYPESADSFFSELRSEAS